MTSQAPCRDPEVVSLKSDFRGDQARMMGVRVCPAPVSIVGRRRPGSGEQERGGTETDELAGRRRRRSAGPVRRNQEGQERDQRTDERSCKAMCGSEPELRGERGQEEAAGAKK